MESAEVKVKVALKENVGGRWRCGRAWLERDVDFEPFVAMHFVRVKMKLHVIVAHLVELGHVLAKFAAQRHAKANGAV